MRKVVRWKLNCRHPGRLSGATDYGGVIEPDTATRSHKTQLRRNLNQISPAQTERTPPLDVSHFNFMGEAL